MNIQNTMDIICFTDGACSHNGKKNARASFAVVFPDHGDHDVGMRVPLTEPQTNNRGELWGCRKALETANVIDPEALRNVHIYTDSMLLINSMTTWIKQWKKNAWMTSTKAPVKNVDLIQSIDALIEQRGNQRVIFHHVRAHTKNQDWESRLNAKVDMLARDACV
jgi:ribonuclease HI